MVYGVWALSLKSLLYFTGDGLLLMFVLNNPFLVVVNREPSNSTNQDCYIIIILLRLLDACYHIIAYCKNI